MRLKGIILFFLITLVVPVVHSCRSANGDEDTNNPILILYDLGHGQFFNETCFSIAFEYLKNDINSNFEIRFSYGDLNSSILSGVDILVMTNPGDKTTLNDPQNLNRQKSQQYAIAQWFLQGKGIFLLSNPYDRTNSTLSGHPATLLHVIRSPYLTIEGVDIRENYLAHNATDVVKGKTSITEISHLNTSISAILSEPSNVSTIVTKSATVRATYEGSTKGIEVITTNITTIAVDNNGIVEEVEREPCIFATIEYEPTDNDYNILEKDIAGKGRIVLSGSTLMFSNLPATPESTQSWINLEDNAVLWVNTLQWLVAESTIESSSTVDELPLTLTFGVLSGIALGLFTLGAGTYFLGSSRPLKPLEREIKDVVVEKETRISRTQKGRRQVRRKKK